MNAKLKLKVNSNLICILNHQSHKMPFYCYYHKLVGHETIFLAFLREINFGVFIDDDEPTIVKSDVLKSRTPSPKEPSKPPSREESRPASKASGIAAAMMEAMKSKSPTISEGRTLSDIGSIPSQRYI